MLGRQDGAFLPFEIPEWHRRVGSTERQPSVMGKTDVGVERFRLRSFVEALVAAGECDVVDGHVDLIDVAARLDGSRKAVWLRDAGGHELVGNVMGSRRRLAMALGASEDGLAHVVRARIERPIAPVRIDSADAPVHEVVRIGADASFLDLPVHVQHALDGAPYISASLDFAVFPETGWTNIGCRRIMLRSATTAGIDLNAPSDLRVLYADHVARGVILPVAYTVGSHPVDFLAGMASAPACDELALLGGLREAPVPIVKCKTNDVYVPADAEYVLEGYLDERGLVEPEGPYGEFLGYYGAMKRNPVFHLTAITARRDALFQTATISGRWLGRTETAQLASIMTESTVCSIVLQAVREPLAVYAPPATGGIYNVRLAMKQRYPGEARNAIAAMFASTANVKHAYVVDGDIDIFEDEQMDWAMATRFQADRDLVLASDFRAAALDPSLAGRRTGAKAGFDMTKPLDRSDAMEFAVPEPPVWQQRPAQSVADALAARPRTFVELMEVLGSRDGRDVVHALGELYAELRLQRTADGRYELKV
jgi:2,5-furandicarboxylate decarboxylase 1